MTKNRGSVLIIGAYLLVVVVTAFGFWQDQQIQDSRREGRQAVCTAFLSLEKSLTDQGQPVPPGLDPALADLGCPHGGTP